MTGRQDDDLYAWAVDHAAQAPRISPADAALLVAIFRDAAVPAEAVARAS